MVFRCHSMTRTGRIMMITFSLMRFSRLVSETGKTCSQIEISGIFRHTLPLNRYGQCFSTNSIRNLSISPQIKISLENGLFAEFMHEHRTYSIYYLTPKTSRTKEKQERSEGKGIKVYILSSAFIVYLYVYQSFHYISVAGSSWSRSRLPLWLMKEKLFVCD